MRPAPFLAIAMMCLTAIPSNAFAILLPEPAPRAHWECVPFARAISGVAIHGDAHTWWDQAEGIYKRSNRPKTGAVLAFMPHGGMQLGHVAVVSGIIDARTITVTHANWSLINGTRGQIERNVTVRDVSSAGDWSAVRVWYAPLGDLGTTAWPVHGFIYPKTETGGDSGPVRTGPALRLPYATLRTLDRQPHSVSHRLDYLGALLPTLAQTR
jgi:surface antigen